MAFRASNIIPATEYNRAKQLAFQLKRLAQARSTSFATGANSDEILAVIDNLNGFKVGLNLIKAIPGIAAFASAQEDDPTYDVAVQFNAMLAAIDAVITNIVTTLPKDGGGFLLIRTIAADGSLTPRAFTGPQLSQIRTLLDSLDSSIS